MSLSHDRHRRSDTRTTRLIRVHIEDDGVSVSPPQRARLERGDTLVWYFHNLPRGYRPALDFVRFTPRRGKSRRPVNLQPFRRLVGEGETVVGEGLRGWPGVYHYQVLLLPADAADAAGNEAIRGREAVLEVAVPREAASRRRTAARRTAAP